MSPYTDQLLSHLLPNIQYANHWKYKVSLHFPKVLHAQSCWYQTLLAVELNLLYF